MPEDKHLALCCPGPRAAHVLDGIIPATEVDASSLVKIIDQGPLGSCVANAWAQVIRGEQVRQGEDQDATPFLSRLFLYYVSRAQHGDIRNDNGTFLCVAGDCVARAGYCPEAVWPYEVERFADSPSTDAWHAAFDQRGKVDVDYHRLDGDGVSGGDLIRTIQQALTAGFLVAFGTQVSVDYCDGECGSPDNPLPPPYGKKIAGGHAQTICGYGIGANGLYFKVANSWGTGWGDSGFAYYSPEYLTWSKTGDMWIATSAKRYSGAK